MLMWGARLEIPAVLNSFPPQGIHSDRGAAANKRWLARAKLCICRPHVPLNRASRFDVNHNCQPQPSHLNRSWGFAFVAVLPQCGHFIVQIRVMTPLQNFSLRIVCYS